MTDDDTKRERLAHRSPGDGRAQEEALTEVCARFADLCQYFSQQNMDLPPQIVEEIRMISELSMNDRITRMKRLNQELMEYFNDAGPGPQVRQ